MKVLLSVFLAILFFATNIYVNIGTHFCGGRAVKSELMLGHSSLMCGMTEDDDSCERKFSDSRNLVKERDCCRDEFNSIHVEDNFNKRLPFEFFFSNTFLIFRHSIEIANSEIEFKHSLSSDRAPPLIIKNEQVLYQTFLI